MSGTDIVNSVESGRIAHVHGAAPATRGDHHARQPMNQLLSLPSSRRPHENPTHEPYSSYETLAPYFSQDSLTFKKTIERHVLPIFNERVRLTEEYADKEEGFPNHCPSFQEIQDVLERERQRGNYEMTSMHHQEIDAYDNWDLRNFVAYLVYGIRQELFHLQGSPYAGLPYPRMRTDRAYSIFLLLLAMYVQLSPEDRAVQVRKTETAVAPMKGLKRMTNDEKLSHLTFRDVVDPNTDASQKLRERFIVRLLRKIVGDDVQENPLQHMFYRVTANPTQARLIGADHLLGVDATALADWEDDHQIDRTNASPALLKSLYDEFQHVKSRDEASSTGQQSAGEATGEGLEQHIVNHDGRLTIIMVLTSNDSGSVEKAISDAERIGGVERVQEETGRETAFESPSTQSTDELKSIGNTSDVMPAIDLNDEDFRARQKLFMGAQATHTFTAEELRTAMSELHIATRSKPIIPGQRKGKTLIWNQILAAARIKRMAMRRYLHGSGYQGTMICDDTGMGKTNSALAGLLAFINEQQLSLNQLRANHDWTGLAKAPAPRAHFWITQSHLVLQAAKDAVSFSQVFDIHIYGGEKEKQEILPHFVERQGPALTKDNAFLSKQHTQTRHTLFITTYETFAARHGPNALIKWVTKYTTYTRDEAKTMARNDQIPEEWPGWLSGRVGIAILDECHRTRNYDAQSSQAIRWADPSFRVLLTATPVPWAATAFGGLLALIQDPQVNAEARGIVHKMDTEPDPRFRFVYHSQCDPSYVKYRYTFSAFQYHMRGSLSMESQERILRYAWEATMLRRTHLSSCVTHPNGDTHFMGNLLPTSLAVRVNIENTQRNQELYRVGEKDLVRSLYIRDRHSDEIHVNARVLRKLTMGCFCPILFFAKSMEEVDDNPFMYELNALHDQGKFARYLQKVLTDAQAGAVAEGVQDLLIGSKVPSLGETPLLVLNFIFRSERIRMIIATIADIVCRKEEKVIVFCQSPTEQEILNCLLSLVEIKSEAHLSRYEMEVKNDFLDRFNKPLRRHEVWGIADKYSNNEIECLLLSVNQNTGLNLQHFCNSVILTGPAASDPIFLQCCGRVVRIGQKNHCLIMEFYDHATHNRSIVMKRNRRAISSLSDFQNPGSLSSGT